MSFTIKNIKLSELEEYLESDEYTSSSFVPISKIRAISYLNNPRTDKEDICLFLAYIDNKFVGYLGALADRLYKAQDFEKVFWLSCMWVLPEYRRDGVALKLLKHAYDTFSGRVLITNFIPRSKKAFEKTNQYFNWKELNGIRGYHLFDLSTLLIRRYSKLNFLKPILKLLDAVGNAALQLKYKHKRKQLSLNSEFSEIDVFNEELRFFLQPYIQKSIFQRSIDEFKWVKEYPWVQKIESLSKESERYYFSQESKDFEQQFIQVKQSGEIVGFFMLTFFNGELKMPYLYCADEVKNDIANYIALRLITKKVKTFIAYNKVLNNNLVDLGVLYHKRSSTYGFLAGNELENTLKATTVDLAYGDGDGIFT